MRFKELRRGLAQLEGSPDDLAEAGIGVLQRQNIKTY